MIAASTEGAASFKAKIRVLAAGNLLDSLPAVIVSLNGMIPAPLLEAAWATAGKFISRRISSPLDRATDHTPAMHVMALANALRQLAGLTPGKLVTIETKTGSATHAALVAKERNASLLAVETAFGLLAGASAGDEAIKTSFGKLLYEAGIRKGTWASASATRLGLPWTIAADAPNPFVRVGQGFRQRLFWRHMDGETTNLGATIAQDKRFTNSLLKRAGLPVPEQQLVPDAAAALKVAKTMGWPVVIKPVGHGGGTGVTAGITSEQELADAFERARRYGEVLVEQHIAGDHHRLFVFRGKLISAQRFTPGHVVGDGQSTVRELLDQTNAARTPFLSEAWKQIELDEQAMAMINRLGLDLDSVPEAGQHVPLRSQSNLSAGGTYEILTDKVHPENRRLAETAARLVSMEVCGVDFITPDISRSWLEVGGAFNELNKNPSYMLGGPEPPWADRFMDAWFPAPERGRIPTILLLSDSPETGLGKTLVETVFTTPERVGWVTAAQVSFGSERSRGSGAIAEQVEAAIADPLAVGLVISATPRDLEQGGAGLDRCDLVIVTGPLDAASSVALRAVLRIGQQILVSSHVAETFGNLLAGNPSVSLVSDADQMPAQAAALMRAMPGIGPHIRGGAPDHGKIGSTSE